MYVPRKSPTGVPRKLPITFEGGGGAVLAILASHGHGFLRLVTVAIYAVVLLVMIP